MAGDRFAPRAPLPPSPPQPPDRLLFTRRVGVAAAVVLAVVFLGCMSISIGGRSTVEGPDHPFKQEGEVDLPGGAEQDVYYPVPYAHPPNLNLPDHADGILILEQKEDHFRVKNSSLFQATVGWKARGVQAPPPVPVVVPAGPPAPPPDPAPPLPATPVPISPPAPSR